MHGSEAKRRRKEEEYQELEGKLLEARGKREVRLIWAAPPRSLLWLKAAALSCAGDRGGHRHGCCRVLEDHGAILGDPAASAV